MSYITLAGNNQGRQVSGTTSNFAAQSEAIKRLTSISGSDGGVSFATLLQNQLSTGQANTNLSTANSAASAIDKILASVLGVSGGKVLKTATTSAASVNTDKTSSATSTTSSSDSNDTTGSVNNR